MGSSQTPAEAEGPGNTPDDAIAELDTLRRERVALERQLLQRTRELGATEAIAQAISTGQLDLAETLARALQVILDLIGLPAAWISLLPEEAEEPVLISSAGLPQEIVEKQSSFRFPDCECAAAIASRRPLVIHPLHASCPIRAQGLEDGQSMACHAAVPLLTGTRALGVLNLAGYNPASFGEDLLALLAAIGRQLGMAIENARLGEELKRRDLLRGQLLERAIAVQEDERQQIARELHDQTGQALTSILVWLRALEAEAESPAGVTLSPDRLLELKAIVADTLDGVRNLAMDLRPSVLDDLGLVPALQRYVRTCQERHHLAVDFQTVGLEGVRLPAPVETALYRIVQEALTNAAQHANASEAGLLLEARAGAVVAIVEDDGCGFDVSRLVSGEMAERWLGLSGMRERAELLGGRLTIESTPGAGTTLFIEVPL